MKFHLNFTPTESTYKLSHQEGVLFIGSCFSEHIATKLNTLKFNCLSNPFGIVFNPESISSQLLRCINKTYFITEDVFEVNRAWFSLQAHSGLFNDNKVEFLNQLNNQIDIWHHQLKKAKTLVITLGSAYAYKHIESNAIVANCHKLHATFFQKQLLSLNTLKQTYAQLIKELLNLNSQLQILFTVSPVKHLKDGIIENTRSKAILIEIAHTMVDEHKNCTYFPAYELVTDDLRDYRFFETDLAHPNKQAIDYVWQKFSDYYFSEQTTTLNTKLQELLNAINHKPFNANGTEYILFKKTHLDKCEQLKKQFPFLNLESELAFFK